MLIVDMGAESVTASYHADGQIIEADFPKVCLRKV